MIFHDRTYAAFLLEEYLRPYRETDTILLAIPRGGVPIGFQLAKLLHLPLGIIQCKKIGHPSNPEYAIGAVSEDEVLLEKEGKEASEEFLAQEASRIQQSFKEKKKLFGLTDDPLDLRNKTVIVIDDGIATGKTLKACIAQIRRKFPKKIIIAVPVSSRQAKALLTPLVDDFICLHTPFDLQAISLYYEHFPQVGDEEVRKLLAETKIFSRNKTIA